MIAPEAMVECLRVWALNTKKLATVIEDEVDGALH